MSILIKGMTMPESCCDCPLCYDMMECSASTIRFFKSKEIVFDFCTERHPSCPLVPVPPHGRLIDADAYSAEMKKRQDACAEWRDDIKNGGGYGTELYYRADSALAGFIEAKLALDKIPTIIEAEEGCGRCDHCRIPHTGTCRYGEESE